MTVITGDQIRMARAALKITVRELADMTGVTKNTIVRTEAGGKVFYQTMLRMQAALEAAGVKFVEPAEGEHGPGVLLKWGVDPSKRVATSGATEDKSGEGLKRACDLDLADFMAGPMWSKLSEEGRSAIADAAYDQCG